MLLKTVGGRSTILFAVSAFLLITTSLYLFTTHHPPASSSPTHNDDASPPSPAIRYKPLLTEPPSPPITDSFPAAAKATSPADLPPPPPFNQAKPGHGQGQSGAPTPLFIGFTRAWPVLQQAVVSYIAAGWPADSIFVVENTGTFSMNRDGRLDLQNPFYLDYARLTRVLGVNVITTPALLSFAQLQNFYMWQAAERGLSTYFWSHMDVVALSEETWTTANPDDPEQTTGKYLSLYQRTVAARDKAVAGGYGERWAVLFFAYDRLTLVNLAAYVDVGGWDTMIGYYLTDCDMHERLMMNGWKMEISDVGKVFDVGSSLDDLGVFYRRVDWPAPAPDNDGNGTGRDGGGVADLGTLDQRGGPGFQRLRDQCQALEDRKMTNGPGGRNWWQAVQRGGQADPFYVDPDGFTRALWLTIEGGRAIYAEKWGHRDCDLRAVGLQPGDAWRVRHDWDEG